MLFEFEELREITLLVDGEEGSELLGEGLAFCEGEGFLSVDLSTEVFDELESDFVVLECFNVEAVLFAALSEDRGDTFFVFGDSLEEPVQVLVGVFEFLLVSSEDDVQASTFFLLVRELG